MGLRVKSWNKFQHFKDRTPPWVKLYRDLLDDPDWHELDGESAKTLTMLWLIASEDETHSGLLPDTRKLAFRLRVNEIKLKQTLTKLSHWLEQSDISAISERYQDDAPETETERETETDIPVSSPAKADDGFDEFWKAYPKKKSKGDAEKAWKKFKPSSDQVSLIISKVEALKSTEQWSKDGGKYIPFPASWLNAKGWEDEVEFGLQQPETSERYRKMVAQMQEAA